MIKFFLARVLKWAASIDWEQFLLVVSAAKNAADLFPKEPGITTEWIKEINNKRAEHVGKAAARYFPSLPSWALNLLRELAVAWLNRSAK